MAGELSEAAKAEIRTAIQIVREDKFEQFVRSRAAKPADPKPADPPTPPTNEPPKPPVDAPPPKDTPPTPPVDTPPVSNYSAYWGEILND